MLTKCESVYNFEMAILEAIILSANPDVIYDEVWADVRAPVRDLLWDIVGWVRKELEC